MLQIKLLRIVFFGTTSFAAFQLYALVRTYSYKIVAVFTQINQTSKYIPSLSMSIFEITKKYNLSLFQSNILSISDIIHIVKKLDVDLIIVSSYGLILPKEILNIPKLGCINVHGSLLPRWRGPAPIQRALEHGDSTTGVSIIQMDLGIDTGNILYSMTCNIAPKDTSYTLSNRLANIGTIALLQTLTQIISGKFSPISQNETYATYAYKLTKKEAHIDWTLPAIQIERCIRAFNPWPISYFYVKKNHIRVWSAEINDQNIMHYKIPNPSILIPGTILHTDPYGIHVITGSGILTLTILQIPGKKKMPVRDILNAYRKWFLPNSILS